MQATPTTLQRWALEYVSSSSLDYKLSPPPAPRAIEACDGVVIAAPGRPPELRAGEHAPKSPGREALRDPKRRAQLVHTFLHHELQAAELMCWAILRFSDAPHAFLRGLAKIAEDEVRHMQMYELYLRKLGFRYGDFPVRDWFWERVPAAKDARAFVATFGMGFEAGNLDHTTRFAERFRAIGDEDGARMQEIVGDEEVPHVKFALHWFSRLESCDSRVGHDDAHATQADLDTNADASARTVRFDEWMSTLPSPLSPMVMRGRPLHRDARRKAGFDDAFLDALERWEPSALGPSVPT